MTVQYKSTMCDSTMQKLALSVSHLMYLNFKRIVILQPNNVIENLFNSCSKLKTYLSAFQFDP